MAGYFNSKREVFRPLRMEFRGNSSAPLTQWNNEGNTFPKRLRNSLLQDTYSYRTRSNDLERSFTKPNGVVEYVSHKEVSPLENALKLNNFSTPYDNGHEFNTVKQEVRIEDPVTCLSLWGGYFHGSLIPSTFGSEEFDIVIPDVPIKYGASLIAKAAPTKPSAQVLTALGDILLGGLPFMQGSSIFASIIKMEERGRAFKSLLKSSGDEYLNQVFGWLPLINDINSTIAALSDATSILIQFEKDAGQNVRRTRSIPDSSSIETLMDRDTPGFAAGLYGFNSMGIEDQQRFFTGDGGAISRQRVYRQTDQSIWFTGAFTYALTVGNGLMDRLTHFEQLASRWLGLRITPEVLWELTPWSWLADWFTNIGDIFANVSRFSNDNLVMRYGYLMCHTKVYTTHVVTHTGDFLSLGRPECSATHVIERKQRVRATPYGFGLDLEGLSPEQWAILTALGLTKADRKVW